MFVLALCLSISLIKSQGLVSKYYIHISDSAFSYFIIRMNFKYIDPLGDMKIMCK